MFVIVVNHANPYGFGFIRMSRASRQRGADLKVERNLLGGMNASEREMEQKKERETRQKKEEWKKKKSGKKEEDFRVQPKDQRVRVCKTGRNVAPFTGACRIPDAQEWIADALYDEFRRSVQDLYKKEVRQVMLILTSYYRKSKEAHRRWPLVPIEAYREVFHILFKTDVVLVDGSTVRLGALQLPYNLVPVLLGPTKLQLEGIMGIPIVCPKSLRVPEVQKSVTETRVLVKRFPEEGVQILLIPERQWEDHRLFGKTITRYQEVKGNRARTAKQLIRKKFAAGRNGTKQGDDDIDFVADIASLFKMEKEFLLSLRFTPDLCLYTPWNDEIISASCYEEMLLTGPRLLELKEIWLACAITQEENNLRMNKQVMFLKTLSKAQKVARNCSGDYRREAQNLVLRAADLYYSYVENHLEYALLLYRMGNLERCVHILKREFICFSLLSKMTKRVGYFNGCILQGEITGKDDVEGLVVNPILQKAEDYDMFWESFEGLTQGEWSIDEFLGDFGGENAREKFHEDADYLFTQLPTDKMHLWEQFVRLFHFHDRIFKVGEIHVPLLHQTQFETPKLAALNRYAVLEDEEEESPQSGPANSVKLETAAVANPLHQPAPIQRQSEKQVKVPPGIRLEGENIVIEDLDLSDLPAVRDFLNENANNKNINLLWHILLMKRMSATGAKIDNLVGDLIMYDHFSNFNQSLSTMKSKDFEYLEDFSAWAFGTVDPPTDESSGRVAENTENVLSGLDEASSIPSVQTDPMLTGGDSSEASLPPPRDLPSHGGFGPIPPSPFRMVPPLHRECYYQLMVGCTIKTHKKLVFVNVPDPRWHVPLQKLRRKHLMSSMTAVGSGAYFVYNFKNETYDEHMYAPEENFYIGFDFPWLPLIRCEGWVYDLIITIPDDFYGVTVPNSYWIKDYDLSDVVNFNDHKYHGMHENRKYTVNWTRPREMTSTPIEWLICRFANTYEYPMDVDAPDDDQDTEAPSAKKTWPKSVSTDIKPVALVVQFRARYQSPHFTSVNGLAQVTYSPYSLASWFNAFNYCSWQSSDQSCCWRNEKYITALIATQVSSDCINTASKNTLNTSLVTTVQRDVTSRFNSEFPCLAIHEPELTNHVVINTVNYVQNKLAIRRKEVMGYIIPGNDGARNLNELLRAFGSTVIGYTHYYFKSIAVFLFLVILCIVIYGIWRSAKIKGFTPSDHRRLNDVEEENFAWFLPAALFSTLLGFFIWRLHLWRVEEALKVNYLDSLERGTFMDDYPNVVCPLDRPIRVPAHEYDENIGRSEIPWEDPSLKEAYSYDGQKSEPIYNDFVLPVYESNSFGELIFTLTSPLVQPGKGPTATTKMLLRTIRDPWSGECEFQDMCGHWADYEQHLSDLLHYDHYDVIDLEYDDHIAWADLPSHTPGMAKMYKRALDTIWHLGARARQIYFGKTKLKVKHDELLHCSKQGPRPICAMHETAAVYFGPYIYHATQILKKEWRCELETRHLIRVKGASFDGFFYPVWAPGNDFFSLGNPIDYFENNLNCPEDLCVLLVAGDDTLCLMKIGKRILRFECDYSKFDQSQVSTYWEHVRYGNDLCGSLVNSLTMLELLGVPSEITYLLMDAYHSKMFLEHKGINYRGNLKVAVTGSLPGSMDFFPTGSPATTFNNTVNNVSFWHHLLLNFHFTDDVSLEEAVSINSKYLGFIPKLKFSDCVSSLTFLKGRFLQTDCSMNKIRLYKYVWHPDMGVVIKFGRSKRPINELYPGKNELEASKMYLRGVGLGWSFYPPVPILRAFVRKVVALPVIEGVDPVIDQYKPQLPDGEFEWYDADYQPMLEWYGLDMADITNLETSIASAPDLALICHPAIKNLSKLYE